MRKTAVMTAIAVPVLALSLAACAHHSTTNGTAGVMHVAATSTSAAYDKAQAQAILTKCMPAQNALTEAEWVKTIVVVDKHSKHYAAGQTARKTFETCAGVNPKNDAKFQAQVEQQGAAALKTAATDEVKGDKAAAHAVIKNFTENQIEQDAVADR